MKVTREDGQPLTESELAQISRDQETVPGSRPNWPYVAAGALGVIACGLFIGGQLDLIHLSPVARYGAFAVLVLSAIVAFALSTPRGRRGR